MILRLMLTFCFIVFPCKFLMAKQIMDNAIMIVKNCYDKSTDLSKTFVPCINEEIEKLPDSKDFQIRMKLKSAEKDNNEKISILMVDKTGYMYYCIVTTGKTLIINACAGEQGKPLTQGQMLSIDLPE
ncbi:TPA: hypothetical protein JBF32_11605 [Legionella pneumophila]|nr:hypothetical protein [Legionella pneumophila]HAU0263082.1 hypothetical protein [Legionella pneumophila]HAU0297505.1 hypothetical protein [Legionella pneumophila]HAU0967633.1 hypothetical protein [Legionella pneumophila]HBB6940888.1 hypothetical protein [Legionella pneumophila]